MKLFTLPLLALAAVLASETVSAQSIDFVQTFGEAAEKVTEELSDDGTAGGPADRPTYGNFAPMVQIEADEGATQINLSFAFGSTHPVDEQGPVYSFASNRFKLEGSVPLDQKAGESSPFSFGGLGTGTKFTFSYTRYHSGFRFDENVLKKTTGLINQAELKCANEAIDSWFVSSTQKPESLIERDQYRIMLGQSAAREPGDPRGVQGFVADLKTSEKFPNLGPFVFEACDPGGGTFSNPNALIEKFVSSEAMKAYVKSWKTEQPISFIGADGSWSRDGFDFLDPAAFALDSINRNNFAFSVYGGLIGSNADWSVRAKLAYTKKYEAADEIQLCRPAVGGTQECVTGAGTPPSARKTGLISVEARKLFSGIDGSLPIAIAPQLTYDIRSNDFAIDVPLYLSRNGDGKLTGGIKFGYRSDNEDYGVGLFVGIPFSTWF